VPRAPTDSDDILSDIHRMTVHTGGVDAGTPTGTPTETGAGTNDGTEEEEEEILRIAALIAAM